ncbi:MAG: ribonuclease P protein component [Candidatus Hydrogenedentes bacterium]|nr:ribonuclease P protein component [Candidatus Hydrogenedentota bacterium]
MPGLFSFPKKYRLRKKSEFENVFQKGKRISGRGLICYWLEDESMGYKLGIVISRRVGCAVLRNKIKRYIREFYRLHRPYFKKVGALVVIARPQVSGWTHDEIDAELELLLKQEGILDG